MAKSEPAVSLEYVETVAARLRESPEAKQWLARNGISEAVAMEAQLGLEGQALVVPTLAPDRRQVLRVRRFVAINGRLAPGLRCIGPHDGKALVYGLFLDRTPGFAVTAVFDELDVLVMRSAGIRTAVCVTPEKGCTAAVLAPVVSRDGGGGVVLALGADVRGARKRGLGGDLLMAGAQETTRIHELPGKAATVTDWFLTLPEDERRAAWADLVARTIPDLTVSPEAAGLHELGGELVDGKDFTVAPFTGRITASGLERFGFDSAPRKVLVLELRHRDGTKLTVQHIFGENLAESIAVAPGSDGRWLIDPLRANAVLTWMARTSGGKESIKDVGWMFGFDASQKGREFERFWSKSSVFQAGGAVSNDEVSMVGVGILGRLDLPIPEDGFCAAARALVWKHLACSHVPEFILPLLASAFLAPARRWLWPNEDRFFLWVVGDTGAGKTSRLRHVQSLFGDFPSAKSLLDWLSTGMSVDKLLAMAGDAWMVVDDFPVGRVDPNTLRDMLRQLQGISQGTGRYRLDRGGQLQVPLEARCMVAVSTQSLPTSDVATTARSMVLQVPPLDLTDPKWREHWEAVEANRELLPYAMADWIQWLFDNGAREVKRLALDAIGMAEGMLTTWYGGWRERQNSMRLVQRLAALTHVWLVVLTWLEQRGVVGGTERMVAEAEWNERVLPALGTNLIEAMDDGRVDEGFFARLSSELQAGRCVILREGETQPSPGSIPSWAIDSAKVIGTYATTMANVGARYRTESVAIRLFSSAAQVSGYSEHGGQWKTVLAQLETSGHVVRRRANGGKRVLDLTRKGAEELLSSLPGSPQAET